MTIVTVHKAKTELSKLIARAEAGEEIIIARGDRPVAKLTAILPPAKQPRRPGALKGKADLPDAFFFEPLAEDELDAWEGR